MPRTARSRKPKNRKPPAGRSRWLNRVLMLMFFGVIAVVIVALPAYRWQWRRAGRNRVRTGLELFEKQACAACHRTANGSYRWRADGAVPASLEVIRDALVNGRPPAAGWDTAAMPAYGRRLTAGARESLTRAIGAVTGLVGVPQDQELAAGHDVAVQMGCFRCHGPLGAGGLANPGSMTGAVPGWMRKNLRGLLSSRETFAALLQKGSTPARVPLPWMQGPVLSMPAFGSRLDSTEADLLRRYIAWLNESDNPER